jgi:uncharacterized protein involved in response to NO
MAQLLRIDSPAPSTDSRRFALWRLGFRPFYLLASVFAALSVAIWGAEYAGWLQRAWVAGPMGHAHEMLFGFTMAVVTGFLFTAVGNWTGRPTPTGVALAALAALWVAGRVLMLTPYAVAAAVANVAFPIAVAVGIAIPLAASGNRRNYFFVALLVLMALAVAAVQLAQLGIVPLPGWAGIRIALDVVLFVMAVMGGRVIPMFTNNGVPGSSARRHPAVEKVALGSLLALLAADILGLPDAALVAILALAAASHGVRLALWQPWRTLRTPIVWVLHAAYAWIVVHLVLRALGLLGAVPVPIATHALTVGAIGALTLGMMTRTARGHTGRPLRADAWEVACYVLVLAAAAVRVAGPLLVPAAYVTTVAASALLWSAAYGLYAIRYWPVLTRPRLDGRPG